MRIENPFLGQPVAVEKYKQVSTIDRNKKYHARKEKRSNFLENLRAGLEPKELVKTIKNIIARRFKKQEVLREPHKKTRDELEKEYTEKFALIQDGDYESSEERRTLFLKMTREAVYYELNPNAKWTETDGEVQEREYARGAMVHKFLHPLGLSDRILESGNLDVDQGDLEAVYSTAPTNLEVFDKDTAAKAIDFLFSLQTKVDRNSLIDDMKSRFGCQETIFILEDIFDSWEGYNDNTNDILGDLDDTEEIIPDFKNKAKKLIESCWSVYDRYQRWDETYLVNNDFSLDNLSKNSLPNNWGRIGVTNNFLSALINDYGALRLSAWENGQVDFVLALDDEVVRKFREFGDEEAGRTVVRLAVLRSFSQKIPDVMENEEEKKKDDLKQELLKALEE